MNDRFVGLDAGTSEVKAALFDEHFGQLDEVRTRLVTLRPVPGRSELDPVAVTRAAFDALRQLVDRAAPSTPITALGVTGAMVGAWTLDARGTPTGPGILWDDARTGPLLAAMRESDPDFDRTIFASSGSALQQGCTLPLLAWMAREDPGRLARTAHVLGLKDVLRYHLTGEIATDVSEAAVAPGSARARGRSGQMLALFGLEAHGRLLPHAREGETLAGRVTADVGARTGLPTGLPVAIGAGDVPSSVIGAGRLDPGTLTVILGTTCLVGRTVDEPLFEPEGIGLLFTLPGRRWFRAMVNVAGTTNLDWARTVLAPELGGDFAALEALAASAGCGAGGVTWLPYLSENGIIAPVVDSTARAGFDGLVPTSSRADMVRAVYEGAAFAIADCVDALGAAADAPVRLVGGGARSDFWTQLIADVLERTVERPLGTQLGARGAAMLGAVAAGRHVTIDEALSAARGPVRTLEPARARYAEARVRWRRHRDRRLAPAPTAVV